MKTLTTTLLLTTILFITSCKKDSTTNNNNTTTAGYPVVYSIQCADCTVQYVKDQAGNMATETHKNDSWTYTFNGKDKQALLLNVTNTTGASATVEAKISYTKNGILSEDSEIGTAADGALTFVADSLL